MYKVLWVDDPVWCRRAGEPIEIPNATRVINEMVEQGWQLHSAVSGNDSSSAANKGLYLTFFRT
ncbi:hypothetical protein [Nocardia aurantia]|uniref:DUF4177 domain-containing protein n=1 Tax=Nocardia aurantia TaxID=2585199 RepID=A0A7K0DFK7_9NOCA|nr:hypothetical protein [Nocardia aurantia]MQY24468.1 hypothetical protein [Nocardia aurantia]